MFPTIIFLCCAWFLGVRPKVKLPVQRNRGKGYLIFFRHQNLLSNFFTIGLVYNIFKVPSYPSFRESVRAFFVCKEYKLQYKCRLKWRLYWINHNITESNCNFVHIDRRSFGANLSDTKKGVESKKAGAGLRNCSLSLHHYRFNVRPIRCEHLAHVAVVKLFGSIQDLIDPFFYLTENTPFSARILPCFAKSFTRKHWSLTPNMWDSLMSHYRPTLIASMAGISWGASLRQCY